MRHLQDKNIWPGWELKRLIGVGSRAEVYEIEREIFGRTEQAALKIISVPKDVGELQRLRSGCSEQEAEETLLEQKHIVINQYAMMRQMSGAANFVNCEDIRCLPHEGWPGWDICIKMELLTPLAAAVGREFTEEDVIRLGTDLCRALSLCGRYGIVHRNLKPQNIFLSRNGEFKLGDFGLSGTSEGRVTEGAAANFAAPEIVKREPYGRQADVCSLGLVMYWLLNERRLPFVPLPPAAPSAEEVEEAELRRVGGEELPAPKNGSGALQRIVLRACAADPARRYRDASDMLRELTELELRPADGAPAGRSAETPAASAGGTETTEKKSRGFFGGLIGALLVIALIVAALAAGHFRIGQGEGGISPTGAPPRQSEAAAPAAETGETPPDPAWMESFAVGDLVAFGSYEQDDNLNNGREAIRWIVVERDGTQLTLLSSRCIDACQFQSDGGKARWEDSGIRAWLNGDFIDSAFDETQRAALVEAEIDNPANPVSGVGEGDGTVDRVYLLSMEELERYFPTDPDAAPDAEGNPAPNAAAAACSTPYALGRGAFQQEENKNTWWWLRTTGKDLEHAAYVYSTGLPAVNGGRLASTGGGLRPALRVDLARLGHSGAGLEKVAPRPLIEAGKGDSVLFGRLERDGATESIEWIVLLKKDDRLLLLSKNCLDAAAFHDVQDSVTWGDSSVRAWLNGDFLNTAFSAQEQSLLIVTDQKMKANPSYDTYVGRNTSDRVFLLSWDEAQKYLPSAAERRALFATPGGEACWWLRTPGLDRSRAVYVDGFGLLDFDGAPVTEAGFGVRPAIWVSID